jgi:cell division protein FtsW (lipid II flippase)
LARALRLPELVLVLYAGLLVVAGLALLGLVADGSWSLQELVPGLVFAALLLLTYLALWAADPRTDRLLLPLVGALSGLGLLLAYRLAGEEYGNRQLLWIALGMGLALAIHLFLREVGWLRRYKYTWAVLGLFLVALTFVLGQGPSQSGARLWLVLGPFRFQPSEILKVVLVIFLAGYLEENRELISRARSKVGFLPLPPLPYLLPLLLMWLLSMLFLLIQRDFGAAILFFGLFLAMLYLATARISYLLAGAVAFLAGVVAAYRWVGVVQGRVETWLDPWSQAAQQGYQTVQGLIAMAAGGVLGRGLGQGSPQVVPAVHTDLVLAALGEEMGFLGTFAVILLYMLLVQRGYRIALRATNPFDQLLAAGLTTVLALQSLAILGGTLRLLPLTGIPLPFLSYGGSSLVTNFVIVGLLLKISGGSGRGRLQDGDD